MKDDKLRIGEEKIKGMIKEPERTTYASTKKKFPFLYIIIGIIIIGLGYLVISQDFFSADDMGSMDVDTSGNIILKDAKDPYAVDINQNILDELKWDDFFEQIGGVTQKGFTNEFIFRLKNPINQRINLDNHIETSLYKPVPYNLDVSYETYEYINDSGLKNRIIQECKNFEPPLPNGTKVCKPTYIIYKEYVIDEGWVWTEIENPFDEIDYNEEKIIKVIGKFQPRTGLQNIDYRINAQINDYKYEPEWVWFNTSFNKRKILTITENSHKSDTNWAVLINVTYDSDMQSDFKDVTFANDTAEFDYYIEENYTSNHAMVWVGIPSLTSGSSTSDIYIYYDSDYANSKSDWKDVFIYDFNNNQIDTTLWSTATLDSGGNANVLRVEEVNNRMEMEITDDGSGTGMSANLSSLPTQNITDYWMINFTTPVLDGYGQNPNDQTDVRLKIINALTPSTAYDSFVFHDIDVSGYSSWNNTNWTLVANLSGTDKIYTLYAYNGSTGQAPELSVFKTSTTIPSNVGLALTFDVSLQSTGTWASARIYIEDLRLRKYNQTEPTYSFGEEAQLNSTMSTNDLIFNSTSATGLNLTSDDLHMSFIPITNGSQTSLYANISFIPDFDNSSSDSSYFGNELRFGWHGNNASDYINGFVGVEDGDAYTGIDEGYLGAGGTFDGASDSIDFGEQDVFLPGLNDFTYSIWAYSTGSDSDYPFAFYCDGFNRYHLEVDSNGMVTLFVNVGADTEAVGSNTGNGDFSFNTWNHIVVVGDRDAYTKIYVDGVDETASSSFDDTLDITYSGCDSDGFYIGAKRDNGVNSWNGMLDELHIWNEALSSGEVNELYNSSLSWRNENVALTNGTYYQTSLDSANTTLNEYWRGEIAMSNEIGTELFKSNSILISGVSHNIANLNLNSTSYKNTTLDNVTLKYSVNSAFDSYTTNVTFYRNYTDNNSVNIAYQLLNQNVLEDVINTITLDSGNTTRNQSFLAQITIENSSSIGYFNTSWLLVSPTNVTAVNITMESESGLNASWEDMNVSFAPEDTEAPFTWRVWFWVSGVFNSVSQWFIGEVFNSFIFNQGNFSADDNVTAMVETNATDGEHYFENVTTDIENTAPSTPILQIPENNTITANYTIILECNGSTDPDNSTQDINYEFYVDYLTNEPTTLMQNSTNTTYNFNMTNVAYNGEYWWRCRANDNRSVSSYNGTRRFEVDRRFINSSSMTYNIQAIESSSQTFKINLTYNPLTTSDIEGVFNYNHTNYTATKTDEGNSRFSFSTTLTTPIIESSPLTKGFGWNFTIELLNGTINLNNTFTGTQTFTGLTLTNCSEGNRTLNFLIMDEDDPDTYLNSTLDLEIEYWRSSTGTTKRYNDKLEDDYNYTICLSNVDDYTYADGYIKNTYTDGFTHRYYFFNQSLSENTTYIDLYNFNSTTDKSDLKITLRNKNTYNYYPNLVGKLQRRYIDEGIWRTVQMDQSDDFGLNFFNVREETIDYRLIFIDANNNILKTSNEMKFACTSGLCEITFLLEPFSGTVTSQDLVYDISYDNETGVITLDWNDPTGATSSVRLHVTKETMTGTSEICNPTGTGSAGSLDCDVSAYTGEVYVRVFDSASPEEPTVTRWVKLVSQRLGNLLPVKDSVFWSFGIMITIIGFGIIISPVASVITTIIGLITLLLLGIFTPLTITFVIIACVLGIVIGLKVRE